MSEDNLITGDNSEGVIAYFAESKTLAYADQYRKPKEWKIIELPDFEIRGLCGNNRTGIAVYGDGRQVACMNHKQANAKWHYLSKPHFDIYGIAGVIGEDPDDTDHTLITVYGGTEEEQNDVAFIHSFGDPKRAWRSLQHSPLSIGDMTGTNLEGVAVSSGSQVYYMNDYNDGGKWHRLPDAPITINHMTGNNSRGLIIYGYDYDGNPVLYNNEHYDRKGKEAWHSLSYVGNFWINAMSGDNDRGLVAILEWMGCPEAKSVAYNDNFSRGSWTILERPERRAVKPIPAPAPVRLG